MYRLGKIGTGTLSHDLKRWWTINVRRREDPYLKIGQQNNLSSSVGTDYIWALKDINIEIPDGEILGIIGKNGAGKSTLLKILSRVTTPTTGKIIANGRIASLLEVGTGFHPEMTGRENIYMNGSIMGMTKHEIKRKFDAIVDFAGINQYVDTPVKRYSSGMTVRLGFAVAAHLEPEILVVDEVLAVGDAEFQKKAIGKMQEVSSGEGRTVLFVSHNMASISSLTRSSICLKNGNIAFSGKTSEVISYYLNDAQNQMNNYVAIPDITNPSFTKVEIKTSERNFIHKNGEDLILHFEINMPLDMTGMAISFQIFSKSNDLPIIYGYLFDTVTPILRTKGLHVLECVLSKCKLYQGNYYVKVHMAETKGKIKFQELDKICHFEVIMLDEIIEWGWQKDVCTYTEDFYWKI